MTAFNERTIAEFRANRGRVGAWGPNLVLIHHFGVRTGTERINPAMSRRDGDSWMVVGSAMGATHDPAWIVDLRAHPDVDIEAVVDGDAATVAVHATELHGDERRAEFERFVEMAPAFAQYQQKTARLLPVIRLTPRVAATARP